MRDFGLILIVVGIAIAVFAIAADIKDSKCARDSEMADWNHNKAFWEARDAGKPVPIKPRPSTWTDDEITVRAIVPYGWVLIVAGSVLYGAGAVRDRVEEAGAVRDRIEQHAVKISERLAFIAKQTPRKSEETRHKEAEAAAAEAAAMKKAAEEAAKKVAEEAAKKVAEEEAKKAAEEAAIRRTIPAERKRINLSPWWPASTGGSAALGVTLGVAFIASWAAGGGPLAGIASTTIYYFVIIAVRYATVVLPSRK